MQQNSCDLKHTAFLFPGQGSQSVGMGRELASRYEAARTTFEEANQVLGFDLARLMWAGAEDELNDTLNTQPALYVHSMSAYRVLKELFPHLQPAYVAGHSLGELSALTVAGALPFAEGLRLVRRRGELMKRAGALAPGGMAAILGLDIPTLETICAQASIPGEVVQVANDNCPGQVVLSGARPALERALELAKAAGARRAVLLAVSIAAHSPLMVSVQAEWDAAVAAVPMADAAVPVVGNVTAEPMTRADEFRTDLRAQLTCRVRWTESVRFMTGQGATTFIELGNGNVLTGLLKRIDTSVPGFALSAPREFEVLLDSL
jgi:[acyl-carrier-protein] S-malonyltransferase